MSTAAAGDKACGTVSYKATVTEYSVFEFAVIGSTENNGDFIIPAGGATLSYNIFPDDYRQTTDIDFLQQTGSSQNNGDFIAPAGGATLGYSTFLPDYQQTTP